MPRSRGVVCSIFPQLLWLAKLCSFRLQSLQSKQIFSRPTSCSQGEERLPLRRHAFCLSGRQTWIISIFISLPLPWGRLWTHYFFKIKPEICRHWNAPGCSVDWYTQCGERQYEFMPWWWLSPSCSSVASQLCSAIIYK
jgi:hypothetical protein